MYMRFPTKSGALLGSPHDEDHNTSESYLGPLFMEPSISYCSYRPLAPVPRLAWGPGKIRGVRPRLRILVHNTLDLTLQLQHVPPAARTVQESTSSESTSDI